MAVTAIPSLCELSTILRMRKNVSTTPGLERGTPCQRTDHLAQQIELKELSEYLNNFLAALPLPERKVFLGRYWYAASIREIAEKSGFSESKVKSMLLRTRRKLRTALEEEGLC